MDKEGKGRGRKGREGRKGKGERERGGDNGIGPPSFRTWLRLWAYYQLYLLTGRRQQFIVDDTKIGDTF